MAYTLSISPFSFVRFGNPDAAGVCCDETDVFLLPVVLPNDVQFQFSLLFGTAAQADAAMSDAAGNIMLKMLRGISNTSQTTGANQLYDFTANGYNFTKYRTGPQRVTYAWLNGLPNFNLQLPCDGCFQLAVTGSTGLNNPGIILISNGFIRSCSTCFTSVLEFGSDNNYAEFVYCNTSSFLNRIRLPLYLKEPQYQKDRVVYRQTNGVIRTNKLITTKQYEGGETDYLPEAIHDRLVIAIDHDIVNIESDKYTGGISATNYDIDWQEGKCTAKAKFKALALPFFVKRNNCATC